MCVCVREQEAEQGLTEEIRAPEHVSILKGKGVDKMALEGAEGESWGGGGVLGHRRLRWHDAVWKEVEHPEQARSIQLTWVTSGCAREAKVSEESGEQGCVRDPVLSF